ncbi:MAG: peptidylprolyl isomerase [Prevotellaceae bacterium]|jgi:peptidyl-prolyl cis-trans isomerase B (cyclophilin B)|nr:peptidylprolyl isomerase [Prevotellaceae bacterium]
MKTNGIFLSALILVLVSCGNNPKNTNKKVETKTQTATVTEETQTTTMEEKQLAFDPATLGEEPVLDIQTNEGIITIKLYKETPLHRDNFLKLAAGNFYNGIIFHRVIKGFMIQAGDPASKNPKPGARYGAGGPGYTVDAEFRPQYKHKKGALAAARQGDQVNPEKASSGSQFYIVENAATCAQLDGAYTVFGETINGFDVIDKIAATATDSADRPTKDVVIIDIKPAKK